MSETYSSSALSSLLRAALLGSVTVACVPDFDDNLSLLESRRILAVRAEPAEAPPGAAVELSVLVAATSPDQTGEDKLSWARCSARKPLTELGPVAQDCIEKFGTDADIFEALGSGPKVALTLPTDVCQHFGPLQPPPLPGEVAGRPVDADLTGGYYQPVVLGDDELSTLGTVRLTCGPAGLINSEVIKYNQGYRPNENPEIERLVLVNGKESTPLEPGAETPAATVSPGATVKLEIEWAACPRSPVCGDGLCTSGENQVNCPEDCRVERPLGCSGSETYLTPNPETRTLIERREGLTTAWFATSGTFANEQTARLENEPDETNTSNQWTAPSKAGDVHIWVVLRDDRGGVSWKQYRLEVGP